MARSRTVRNTRAIAKARDEVPRGLLRLPGELLDGTLAYLSQDDLRHVASLSRALHKSAWRSGLYVFRRIQWMNFTRDKEESLAQLNGLIDHVLQKNLRLWLSIWMDFTSIAPPGVYDLARALIVALTRSLPGLVGLSLRVSDDLRPLFYPVLHSPAPVLRIFSVIAPYKERKSPYPTLPLDIFSGGAPQLRTVALEGFIIGSQPVPAFARVRKLIIPSFSVIPSLHIKACFPRVIDLEVSAESTAKDVSGLDFSGLQLRSLVLRGHDPWERISEFRNLQLDAVAEVHLVQCFPVWRGRLWERDIGDFAVQLRVSAPLEGWQISIIPTQRPWRFVYHIIEDDNPLRVAKLDLISTAAHHLTSVRMDNECLHGFLLCAGIEYAALREMCIDLRSKSKAQATLWPPDSPEPELFPECKFPAAARSALTFDGAPKSFYNMQCPALTTLKVFALDKPMRVQASAVAFLGRALGFLERPQSQRPVLELVGVGFAQPESAGRALVNKVFSAVQHSDFVGGVSEDYGELLEHRY
ncbi:hypothetical protein AURDEDRAFT_174105 [Auricularia subglabra TFB-10046 SS5]|nr:hypothetical protein AURDEDRAFT_174105 [Auricularia subglabra TFB-10046 SS5]